MICTRWRLARNYIDGMQLLQYCAVDFGESFSCFDSLCFLYCTVFSDRFQGAGAAAVAGAKKERHSFPQNLLHSLMKLSRSRTLPAGNGAKSGNSQRGGGGGSGCCGSGSHSEREEHSSGKTPSGPQRPLSDQTPSGPTLKSIPTITLLASDDSRAHISRTVYYK